MSYSQIAQVGGSSRPGRLASGPRMANTIFLPSGETSTSLMSYGSLPGHAAGDVAFAPTGRRAIAQVQVRVRHESRTSRTSSCTASPAVRDRPLHVGDREVERRPGRRSGRRRFQLPPLLQAAASAAMPASRPARTLHADSRPRMCFPSSRVAGMSSLILWQVHDRGCDAARHIARQIISLRANRMLSAVSDVAA